jgi:hypothetical protein
LCATGILYRLRSEEQVFGSGVVILTVFRGSVAVGSLTGGVFEEEDNAIYGGELVEKGGVQGY